MEIGVPRAAGFAVGQDAEHSYIEEPVQEDPVAVYATSAASIEEICSR